MKKLFYLFIFLMVLIAFDYYAEDIFPSSDIIEIPLGPFESEITARFEPDPEDLDNDGLSNADEEKYGTDPNDPDTDNDGFTDFWEVINGTDPNSKNTTSYLEVVDIEEKNDKTSSEDIIDINDQSGKIDDIENVPPIPGIENDLPPFPWDDVNDLPKETDEGEIESTDNYNVIVPPDFINEEDLSSSRDKTDDGFSKDTLNDLSGNYQTAMLNGSSTGFDLTPIFMLLLLNDNDGDGMDDDWEMRYFGTLAYDADDDPDSDNLSNIDEYTNHTNPNNPDSDGDGLTDGWEILNGLNPTSTDSDDDTMNDGWEVSHGLNPLVNDAYGDLDNDGFPNYFEYASQTDPNNPNKGSYYEYDELGRIKSALRVK